jgi:hypothetical protein
LPKKTAGSLFGARFSPWNWNARLGRLGNTLILLATLNKGGPKAGSHYEDHFLGPDRMKGQSQTQTRLDSQVERMLSGADKSGADPPVRPERQSAQRKGRPVPLLRSAGVRGLERRRSDHGDLAPAGPGAGAHAPAIGDRGVRGNVNGP